MGGGHQSGRKKKGTPTPPDGGWGWWVVAASFLIHVVADGVAYTFGLFFVYISKEFQETKSATSWITSIMAGMTYGSGPIAGALVNKFGCRATSILGSFVATFGFCISYYAQSVAFLYISIGLVGGLGLGLIYLPAIVSVTSYFEKRRSFATGIAVCGSGFGTFLLAPLIEIIIRHYEWRPALVITGAIIFTCFFFSCFFKPLPDDEDTDEATENPRFPSILEPDVQMPLIKSPEHPGSPQSAVEPLEKQCFAVQYLKPSHNETLTMSCSQPALRGVIGSIDSLHRFDPSRKRHSLRMTSFGKVFDQNQNSADATPGLIVQRKDIFYSGSLVKIPDANNQNGSSRTLDHINMRPLDGDDARSQKKCCGCLPCPAEIKEAFNSMTDFTILKDPIFLFFAFSNFFTSIGYNVPYIYLVDMAVGNDPDNPIHTMKQAGFLLAIVGIANTISRVILGYLSDKTWMNRLYLYNGALAVCGLSIAVAPHVYEDLLALQICAATFGATVGVYVSLTSVLIVDLLGLEKLTNAFGLLLLFQGVATVIGPPIVGDLCDHFNNHKYGFGLAGGMIAISGIMLFFIPLLQRRKKAEETSSAATEQQALSSGNQSCADINGTTKDDHNNQCNGVCNGAVTKFSNNNFNEV
ncbi:unnamed protein product [Orchesella dallaii]|uniref:Major facilitator superfamily (MFS) profile domain-containing protein n=1 Tax=Orchesella dallaii TaxID=48710 RepID=A0ABP1R7V6_9HEXA